MINIRPISDLRNKFTEVEQDVLTNDAPVFLTKNGYGSMVLMSLEQYSALTDTIKYELKQTDIYARENTTRYTLDDVINSAKEIIHGGESL